MKRKEELKKASSEEKDEGLQIVSMDDIDNIDKPDNSVSKTKSFVFGKKARVIITVIAAVVFFVAAFSLFEILLGYKNAQDSYNDLDNKYTKVSANRINEDEDSGEFPEEYVNFYVDFDGLKKENDEVVAWIKFEGVDINYPIVQGANNDYYLTHTTKKEENKSGSIFMDYNNTSDFSDMNTIIYGHNMKDGSMFGLMGKYKNEEFYPGKERFWIYTPEGAYCYLIFSCYEPSADDSNVYTIWKTPSEQYGLYLNAAKEAAKYPTLETDLTQDSKIVTLSTCTNRGAEYRFVVQGKLIKKFPNR